MSINKTVTAASFSVAYVLPEMEQIVRKIATFYRFSLVLKRSGICSGIEYLVTDCQMTKSEEASQLPHKMH